MSKYSPDLDHYAAIFHALGSAHRLEIYLRLAQCCAPSSMSCVEGEECPCVGEFSHALGLAPSTISHHVKELIQAGLICTEREGQTIRCWADAEALADLAGLFLGWAAQCPGLSGEQVDSIKQWGGLHE